MIKTLAAILLAMLAAVPAVAADKISSLALGLYKPEDKAALTLSFINAVNHYLRRYEPRLLERQGDYAKMQVEYDYDYDVELRVKEAEYEITVTLAEKTSRTGKAQEQAAKLASGVQRTLEKMLVRAGRGR